MRLVSSAIFTVLMSTVQADPLTIDASHAAAPQAVDLGQGTSTDPQGHAWTADSQTLYLDGKPFFVIAGEFHYSRYPRAEWRDELLKMKAGGINTVSTYVFWIHQEEVQGKPDWSDRRSLHDFLQLCQDLGLKAIVRLGPWAHGEARNGGLPDWVLNLHTHSRTEDPKFLALVQPYYQQIADQMKGLLWKDGGPVIGVQLDNETGNFKYLFALKKMAQAVGIDVPFYTMTGWNHVRFPKEGLLPMLGGYPDGFWNGYVDSYADCYVFSPIRDRELMGKDLSDQSKGLAQDEARFPYTCCEIGGGMASSVSRRLQIAPEDIAALVWSLLGSGANMHGYYMYHGGSNPDGLTHLNEEKPNGMPVKDYDFNAPLGACGEVRGQYHLLRELHFFLRDFGSQVAGMPAFFPDQMPTGFHDLKTPRWSVRSDGHSGFLFLNNYARYDKMRDLPDTQFSVKLKQGTILVPAEPITIPSGIFGVWPINLDCDGVTLTYATALPLARIVDGKAAWYFFAAMAGIDPDFSFVSTPATLHCGASHITKSDSSLRVNQIKPGTGEAFGFTRDDGSSVHFVVLSPGQARQLWRAPYAGQDRLILSDATVLSDKDGLRLQGDIPHFTYGFFPSISGSGGANSGVFEVIYPVPSSPSALLPAITTDLESPASPSNPNVNPLDDASWKNAAIWKLHIPADAAKRHLLLGIHYVGNAARLYDGDTLLDDNLYNGAPFDVGLWRISADDYDKLRLKILPWTDDLAGRLPAEVRAALPAQNKDAVTVTVTEQSETVVPTPSR